MLPLTPPAHCPKSSPFVAAACLTLVAMSLPGAALAADEGSAVEDMLVRDSKVTLQLRTYFFDKLNPAPKNANQAWAIGGWLDYQSGWLGDVFSFGLTAYTSQPLWAPADAPGSNLLTATQDGYSVLGQSYVALKLFEQTLTGGRFEVNQPEVNLQDNRMTPNTFEGGALTGKLAGVDYFAGYLSAEKTRNATTFVSMSEVAGAPSSVDSGMWLLGLKGEPVKDLVLRFSTYQVPDVLNSTYADAAWTLALSGGSKLRLGAQTIYQSSNGIDSIGTFSVGYGGVKADLTSGGLTGTLGYNQTGRNSSLRTPYSSWAGYTSMLIKDFYDAGQKAVLVGASYDFKGIDLPGLTLGGQIATGWDAINPSSGAALANSTEYDLDLNYRFNDKSWPKWVQPLWIRMRAGVLVPTSGARTENYRIILNYPFELK
jgi:hypothetical protein